MSFAFNSPDRLAPETASRIRDVAEQLGYRPHPVARMLTQRQTMTIGVLTPQALSVIFSNPFFGAFSEGVALAAEESGYALHFISPLHGSLARAMSRATVDGVVAIKEASFDARRFIDTARLIEDLPRPITLLTGNDNFILESFMLGATGALIGFGAVMTREQVDMIDAWNAGRIDEARALGKRVQRLADVVFARPVGDYRVRLKECLRILGVLENARVRPPLQPISDAERAHLADVLREVGLLDAAGKPVTAAPAPALARA